MFRRNFLSTGLAASALLAAPAWAQDEVQKIRDLYKRGGALSDMATQNKGKRISFEGYMAPPLKAESKLFVLTNIPMAVCPFCGDDAEWPDNILAIYTKRNVEYLDYNIKFVARGILELGSFRDPDTGFVSLIRLTDATYALG